MCKQSFHTKFACTNIKKIGFERNRERVCEEWEQWGIAVNTVINIHVPSPF